jgi:hypothetical protein
VVQPHPMVGGQLDCDVRGRRNGLFREKRRCRRAHAAGHSRAVVTMNKAATGVAALQSASRSSRVSRDREHRHVVVRWNGAEVLADSLLDRCEQVRRIRGVHPAEK